MKVGRWLAMYGAAGALVAVIVCCTGDPPLAVPAGDSGPAVPPGGSEVPTDGGVTACSAEQTSCGGSCVDLTRDPRHCGRCARACGPDSTCTAGRCAAVSLVGDLERASAIALGSGVVVLNVEGRLARCGKEGCRGGVTPLWTYAAVAAVPGALSLSPDKGQAFTLGKADAGSGYVEDINVLSVSVDGDPPLVPMVRSTGLTPPFELSLAFAIASDAREHAIASPYRTYRSFALTPGQITRLGEGETPSSIILTPTHYAWTFTGFATVRVCPRPAPGVDDYGDAPECSPATDLMPLIQRDAGFLAHHDGVVYWADWSTNGGATGRVLACAVTGCAGSPLLVAEEEQVISGLAVDASGVYWTNETSGTVRACRDLVRGCGTRAETLVGGLTAPGPIALDETYAYVIARGVAPRTGELVRVAK